MEEFFKTNKPADFLKVEFEDEDNGDMCAGTQAILFLCKYARNAGSREEIRKLMVESRKKMAETIEEEGVGAYPALGLGGEEIHLSFLDVLTISDLAFCFWQYFNSYDDWIYKIENKDKAGVKYKCRTRWTSDKGTTSSVSEEGAKVYADLHSWFAELKSLKNTREYMKFRVGLNGVSSLLGLVKDYSGKTTVLKNVEEEEEEVEEVAVFGMEEFGHVVGV